MIFIKKILFSIHKNRMYLGVAFVAGLLIDLFYFNAGFNTFTLFLYLFSIIMFNVFNIGSIVSSSSFFVFLGVSIVSLLFKNELLAEGFAIWTFLALITAVVQSSMSFRKFCRE